LRVHQTEPPPVEGDLARLSARRLNDMKPVRPLHGNDERSILDPTPSRGSRWWDAVRRIVCALPSFAATDLASARAAGSIWAWPRWDGNPVKSARAANADNDWWWNGMVGMLVIWQVVMRAPECWRRLTAVHRDLACADRGPRTRERASPGPRQTLRRRQRPRSRSRKPAEADRVLCEPVPPHPPQQWLSRLVPSGMSMETDCRKSYKTLVRYPTGPRAGRPRHQRVEPFGSFASTGRVKGKVAPRLRSLLKYSCDPRESALGRMARRE
jgi:hypothetical protein